MKKTQTCLYALLALALTALLPGAPALAQDDVDFDNNDSPLAYDPLEGFNRSMFAVNEGLDKAILKPVAQGYEAALPLPARVGVDNFYDNFSELGRSGNAFLQGKPERGFTALGRLVVNSTLGIFGLFDVASEIGLEESDEDFGQTLGTWDVPGGPYLFLPLIGPKNARDLVGWSVDQATSPLWAQTDRYAHLRDGLRVMNVVRARANMLPFDQIIEEASFDKYSYIRSAYLQRRNAQIRD